MDDQNMPVIETEVDVEELETKLVPNSTAGFLD